MSKALEKVKAALGKRIVYLSEIKAANPNKVVKDNCTSQIEGLRFALEVLEQEARK